MNLPKTGPRYGIVYYDRECHAWLRLRDGFYGPDRLWPSRQMAEAWLAEAQLEQRELFNLPGAPAHFGFHVALFQES